MKKNLKTLILFIVILGSCTGQENNDALNLDYIPELANYNALKFPEQVYSLDIRETPTGFENYKNLKRLVFTFMSIGQSELNEINKIKGLIDLSFRNCSIKSYDFSQEVLSSIKVLEVTSSQISNPELMAEAISRMHKLEKLYVDDVNFKHLLDSWSTLDKLETICIRNDSIAFSFDLLFKNISKLKSCKNLCFSRLRIDSFPESFQRLKHLENISFDDCKNLTAEDILLSIEKWSNVKYLGLVDMNITSLPQEIIKLKQLREVNISYNENIDLKQALALLIKMDAIEELDISGCMRTTMNMPIDEKIGILDDLAKMKKLKRLEIADNRFIKSEYLWSILANLTNLEELNLRFSSTGRIGNEIFNMKELRKLNIYNTHRNILANLQSLPPSVETIDFSWSEIKYLPIQILNSSRLKSVSLKSNEIKKVPESISKMVNLVHLDLSQNYISDLPESIKELKTTLKYLNLKSNPFLTNETITKIKKWLPDTIIFHN